MVNSRPIVSLLKWRNCIMRLRQPWENFRASLSCLRQGRKPSRARQAPDDTLEPLAFGGSTRPHKREKRRRERRPGHTLFLIFHKGGKTGPATLYSLYFTKAGKTGPAALYYWYRITPALGVILRISGKRTYKLHLPTIRSSVSYVKCLVLCIIVSLNHTHTHLAGLPSSTSLGRGRLLKIRNTLFSVSPLPH